MREIISDIIPRFSEYAIFAPGLYHPARKMKIILTASSLAQQHGLSSLSITDKDRDKWNLDSVKDQPLQRTRTSGTRPGPPLLVKTDVQVNGHELSTGLAVEGEAGEKYVGDAKENGEWEPPPIPEIVDEAGNMLMTSKFEYG